MGPESRTPGVTAVEAGVPGHVLASLGGAGGCLGLSIRWALDNQPCHGQGLSLVLRPQGLLPRETTLAEAAGARTCQLSGRCFLGLRTRPRGQRRREAGGGGQGGSEGSVRPAASRSGSGRGTARLLLSSAASPPSRGCSGPASAPAPGGSVSELSVKGGGQVCRPFLPPLCKRDVRRNTPFW